MRYLLILLALGFFGCKKCADCTTVVTTKVTGQNPTTATSRTEMCGEELKEADGYSSTSTSTVNGYTATITTYTTCK